MTEKWIVDDAGTLINIPTRNHYDYMEEVVEELNKYEHTLDNCREAVSYWRRRMSS